MNLNDKPLLSFKEATSRMAKGGKEAMDDPELQAFVERLLDTGNVLSDQLIKIEDDKLIVASLLASVGGFEILKSGNFEGFTILMMLPREVLIPFVMGIMKATLAIAALEEVR
jgi:hypothetical protein